MTNQSRPVAIFDMDGTLANLDHREHLARRGTWDEFFSRCCDDTPNLPVVWWAQSVALTHDVVIVSGRPDSVRVETQNWLARHGVPYAALYMRPAGYRDDDDVIKDRILTWDLGLDFPGQRIDFVVDDRPRVVRMWRARGLKVYPIISTLSERGD